MNFHCERFPSCGCPEGGEKGDRPGKMTTAIDGRMDIPVTNIRLTGVHLDTVSSSGVGIYLSNPTPSDAELLRQAGEALRPFFHIADTEIRDDESDNTKIPVRIGFVRAARAVLAAIDARKP